MLIIVFFWLVQVSKNDLKNKIYSIKIWSIFTRKINYKVKSDSIINVNTCSYCKLIWKKMNYILVIIGSVFNFSFRFGRNSSKNSSVTLNWFKKNKDLNIIQNIPLYKGISFNNMKKNQENLLLNKNNILQMKIKFKLKKIERRIKKSRNNFKLYNIIETDGN